MFVYNYFKGGEGGRDGGGGGGGGGGEGKGVTVLQYHLREMR